MLKYVNHDIVFQEFPDEVTLAVNLSRCPCACPGCHSTYLWGDNGEELTEERWLALVEQYGRTITCAALMGGDNDPSAVLRLLSILRKRIPICTPVGTAAVRNCPMDSMPSTPPLMSSSAHGAQLAAR